MEEALEYIVNNLLSNINKDGICRTLSLKNGCIYEHSNDNDNEIILDNMASVVDWLEEHGYCCYSYDNYIIRKIIYPHTMFLTQKDAEKHLVLNHYHYSADAHTYAMTSWRSQVSTKLWRILQEVNWKELLK